MILSPQIIFRWTDDNGNPAVGWQVETYIAGSSTPVTTYTDSTGASENTNPIILNTRGEADIWLDPSIAYKFVVKNPLGAIQKTVDQITSGSGGSSGLSRVYYNDSASVGFSGLGTLASPLSASVKLSAYPNNALQIRADGLYAMAIGGGGSVAWGSITGNINSQTDLIAKFGDYIAKNGTTTTTATIPFAVGISVTGNNGDGSAIRIPDGSWIRPQTAQGGMYFTNGTSPALANGAIHLTTNYTAMTAGNGTTAFGRLELTDSLARLVATNASGVYKGLLLLGIDTFELSTNNSSGAEVQGSADDLLLKSGSGGSATISYQASAHHNFKWNGSATPPTGTQAYLLGIDASGNLIQGSAGSGYMTLSGHNDLTTPFSFGDGASFAASSAGLQVDPVGAYGLHLKGNILVEQAVSQALSLYRPVASGDVCLNFDAWDSLGSQSSYAQVCGVVVSSTAGAVGGGLDLEVAIAGVMTPLLQLRQAGSILSSPLSLAQNNLSNVNRLSFSQVEGAFLTGQLTATIYSSTQNAGGSYPFTEAGNLIISPRTSVGRDVVISATGVNADFILDRSGNAQVRGNLLVKNAAKTFDYTIVGGAITANRQLNLPVISGTDTIAVLGLPQIFTNTVTARQLAQTRQTSTTVSGSITWTLSSGGAMDLTGSLGGAITMNISAPSAGADSVLFVNQGATRQTVTLSLTGVSWILTGPNGLTGTNTLTIPIDAFTANKSACIKIYWSTTTRAYVTVT